MSVAHRRERAQRHRKRVAVQFGTATLTSGGFTTNVSAWGLGVTAPSIHPPGTRLIVEARLGEQGTARLTARVTWARRGTPALGIQSTMGVRLETADELWFAFVASLSDANRKLTPPVPEPSATAGSRTVLHARPGPPRVVARHPVAWSVRFGLGARLDMTGTTLDVSAMGLALSTPALQDVGTSVFLEVTVPDASAVRCEGVVVRSRRLSVAERRPNAMGVRLLRADEGWYRAVLALDPRSVVPR